MGFDPQKFFIGVVDFFAILMPGLVATYLIGQAGQDHPLADGVRELDGAALVAAFLVSSYLLGHVIFLLGSPLDGLLYQRLRDATPGSLARRAEDGPAPAPWLSWLSRKVLGNTTIDDAALDRAIQLREGHLGKIQAAATMNTFQWSKARLLIEHPAALSKVERFEADSKFFRSLVVLFAVLLVAFAVDQQPWVALTSLVLGALALVRYAEQRLKAVTAAYTHVIVLEASG